MSTSSRWTLLFLVGLLAVLGIEAPRGQSAEESEVAQLKTRVLELTTRVEKLNNQLQRAQDARTRLENRITRLEKGLKELRTAFENRERTGHFQEISSDDLSRIRAGMSAEEVRDILGPPAQVGTVTYSSGGGSGESWLYRITKNDQNKSVQVLFRDGKVKETRGW